jgi:hypothetical protein
MSKIGQWFKRRFKELDLLDKYFPLLFSRWQAALWGGSVLAVAFGWHFITADWPYPVKVSACVAALFFAGYYVWRADHVRLLPQLSVGGVVVQETPTSPTGGRRAAFVQIELICKGDAPVEECRGHLLRVYKRFHGENEWTLTEMKERLDLQWSHKGCVPLTLYKSGGQNLNICSHGNEISIIMPAVSPLPLRWREVFDSTGSFRFDIEITAKDCAPVSASVSVSFDDCKWNQPQVEIL